MKEEELIEFGNKIDQLDEYSKLIVFSCIFEYVLVVDETTDEEVRAVFQNGDVIIEISNEEEQSSKKVTKDEFNKRYQIEEMYGTN